MGVFRETLPPSVAPDEPVAMGTVNGLGSEDSGPDINTQSLIPPAGRQWEKDTRSGGDFRTQRSEKWRVWLSKAKQSTDRGGQESDSEGTRPTEEALVIMETNGDERKMRRLTRGERAGFGWREGAWGGEERGRGRRGLAVLCVWELEMMSFIEAQRGVRKEKSAEKQE